MLAYILRRLGLWTDLEVREALSSLADTLDHAACEEVIDGYSCTQELNVTHRELVSLREGYRTVGEALVAVAQCAPADWVAPDGCPF